MRSVTSARRPIEKADSAGGPAPTGRGDDNAETQGCSASCTALSFGAGGPPALVREPLLPLAPLQLVGQYQKRNIAEFLTSTEATSLMLVSKDMHRAIQADPVLRLNEISPAFERLGCNQLLERIQAVDTEISRLQPNGGPSATRLQHAPESKQQPAPAMATEGAPPGPGLGGASQWFKLARARAAIAFQGREQAKQAAAEKHLHEMEAQKAQLTLQLEALQSGVEGVVFQFSAERMKGPRPPFVADAAAQPTAPAPGKYGRLHKAIEHGEVEMLRVSLREFLSLPPHLVPNARKVDWLRGPEATSTLKSFAQRYCGFLGDGERKSYEAIRTYVDEIVSSSYLEDHDKKKILFRLELDDHPAMRPGAPFVRNSAVAACVLLGIQQSSASRELKHALLEALAAPWTGGIAACIQSVNASLRGYRHRATEWVDRALGGLESIEKSFGGAVETAS